jgi:hypothetical protein
MFEKYFLGDWQTWLLLFFHSIMYNPNTIYPFEPTISCSSHEDIHLPIGHWYFLGFNSIKLQSLIILLLNNFKVYTIFYIIGCPEIWAYVEIGQTGIVQKELTTFVHIPHILFIQNRYSRYLHLPLLNTYQPRYPYLHILIYMSTYLHTNQHLPRYMCRFFLRGPLRPLPALFSFRL